MKPYLLFFLIAMIMTNNANAQSKEKTHKEEITQLVHSLEQATAQRNVADLEGLLHADFRVVVNRFQGQPGATVISRENYLKLLGAQKIGGVSYKTKINRISITGHTAIVDLLFKSDEKPSMHKFMFVIQNEENKWQIVGDLPIFVD